MIYAFLANFFLCVRGSKIHKISLVGHNSNKIKVSIKIEMKNRQTEV